MVTLDDPAQPPTMAQDAFARIRPAIDTPASEVASWRDQVAKVARAVRVVPPPRSAAAPLASTRVDVGQESGTVREEAMKLAAETKDPAVEAMTRRCLDEAGVA